MDEHEFDLVWDYARVCECDAKIGWTWNDDEIKSHLEIAVKFVHNETVKRELQYVLDNVDSYSLGEIRRRTDEIEQELYKQLLDKTYNH